MTAQVDTCLPLRVCLYLCSLFSSYESKKFNLWNLFNFLFPRIPSGMNYLRLR
uniref:Uncharacterized protein n=1 Tax=Parascaris univalens TaxID=6257 RepID=A0A915C296_PARUN